MQIKKAIKKGFTLVELVVVIAVIAILAATSVGVYFGMLESANRSADQQAVVQMNKVLQIENILDGVDSILDVHAALEENGLTAENYTALASDHTFYYDTGYNKILYVKASTYEVEYPEEYNEETYDTRTADGAQWFSLNLTIKETKVDATGGAGTTEAEAKIYTVDSGEELAYVFSTLEEQNKNTKNIKIVLEKDIDLMGSSIAAKTSSNIVIDGNGKTIKNITSNEVGLYSNQNADKEFRNYNTSALFNDVSGKVTVNNLTFKNIYLDGIKENTGLIGIVAGNVNGTGSVTVNNVKIEDSKISGNRSVGALIGATDGKTTINGLELKNVQVRTNNGRSALVIGFYGGGDYDNELDVSNFTKDNVSSYRHIDGISTITNPDASMNHSYGYEDVDTYIYNAEYGKAYGYKENVLVNLVYDGKLRSIDTVEELNNY